MALARIGLGANLGDAVAAVEAALRELASVGRVVARSALYRAPAWGFTAQDDFVNAAALVDTGLSPRELLVALQALEIKLGRVATFRYGPRAIDLDILAYDDVVVSEPDLVIPHERLSERAFALVPLAEIDASYRPALEALPLAERAAVQRIPLAAARSPRAVDWEQTLARVRSAAEFCASAGLARLRIEEDEFGLDVRRAVRSLPAEAALAPEGMATYDGLPAATNGAPAHVEQPMTLLKAEFVGIVRLSRPAVTLGAVLAEDRELAYVESLGIRNPVRSGGPGRIAEIFVSDGESVEYGRPLFAIES